MRFSRAKPTGSFRVFQPGSRRVAVHTETLAEARKDAAYWAKATGSPIEIQERFPSGKWVTRESVSNHARMVSTRGRHAHAHATTRHCYVITMPPTAEVGSYKTKHCGSKAEAREHALWDYNKAREHDGLPPVQRLPAGTKVAKDLTKVV